MSVTAAGDQAARLRLLSFFRHVLPAEAADARFVYSTKRPDRPWTDRAVQTHDQLVQAIVAEDAQGADVYFAVGSFSGTRRLQVESRGAKALWLDIDAGSGKSYAGASEAAAAYKAWCEAVGLPLGTVVLSGHGLHAYWVLDRLASPKEWQAATAELHAAVVAGGLHVDPKRTQDIASVLRPPGTTNRKNGGTAPVIVGAFREPLSLDRIVAALSAFNSKLPHTPRVIPRTIYGPIDATVRKAAREFLAYPSGSGSAALAALSCGWLRAVGVDARGNVAEPLWYAALGVAAFADDRAEVAHAWSDGHAGYAWDATEAKTEQAFQRMDGPTTCAHLEQSWDTSLGANPCFACPHRGTIRSPLALGRPRAQPVIVSAQTTVLSPAIAPSKPPERNDLGNARRFIQHVQGQVRYVTQLQSWLIWNGHTWKRDDRMEAERVVKAALEAMWREYHATPDEEEREAIAKFRNQSLNVGRLDAALKVARSEAGITVAAEDLDSDPWLLGVRNGVIDLRTGQWRPGQPQDMITLSASVAWDGQARCPNWDNFLLTVTNGDAELVGYLQRIAGYCLTGSVVEEVAIILHGAGGNGKTTYLETLHRLLGDYAMASDATILMERKQVSGPTPEIARLRGKRLVNINETEQEARLNESRVKYITSTDTISAREPYGKLFDFRPTHKTIIRTNHEPIVQGVDRGIWRRLKLVPFLHSFSDDQKDAAFLEKKLMPELPGILNWAIAGLMAYHREGLRPPRSVQSATDAYRHEQDTLGQWLEERCVMERGALVSFAAAYLDYEQWMMTNQGYARSRAKFARDMHAKGFERERTSNERQLRGLRLRSAVERQNVVPFKK